MEKRKVAIEREDSGAREAAGGGEDVGSLSLRGLVAATTSAMSPLAVARESARLYGEWVKILVGKSAREVPAKDWRFADPTWREHPICKRAAQGYLAFCDAIDHVVGSNPDWRKRERARFLTGMQMLVRGGRRSGREKPAPKTPGNRKYKVRGKAPGTYVLEQAQPCRPR